MDVLATWGQLKQAVNTTPSITLLVDMVSTSAQQVFTHPTDTDKIQDYLDMFFCPPEDCKSNIHSAFSSVCVLHQLLMEISGY